MSFTTDAVISCSSGRTLTLINAFFPEGEGFVSWRSPESPARRVAHLVRPHRDQQVTCQGERGAAWHRLARQRGRSAPPRGWYGGTKLLGDGFAVGCFNYLQLDELKTHILSLTGLGGEYVHLLTHREDQTTFQVWHHEFRPS